jgi:SOS-response transcriptional repressor LexA
MTMTRRRAHRRPEGLSKREQHIQQTTEQVYAFIARYIDENHGPPSIAEIAQAMYLAPSSVLRYIDRLEAQQRLYRKEYQARNIVLVEEDAEDEPVPPERRLPDGRHKP